jgi:methylase of polypeptide subunit release factors
MTSAELHNLINNLKGLLPLANSHMVHFITHNSFERMLPMSLQEEIMSLDVDELNKIVLRTFSNERAVQLNKKIPNLVNFLNENQKLSLRKNCLCLSLEQVFEKLQSKKQNESANHILKHLMSVKKSHEVEVMSAVVAAIAQEENCSHIVDVGGGKGYLSSVLALKHQLKVLSVDSSHVTSKGAEKQMPKIEVRSKSV